MHLVPVGSRPGHVIPARRYLLFFFFTCWLTPIAIQADPYPSPPAIPPADLATLQITATPERTTYRLGETVRVRYSVRNRGTETITIRRDNDTTFWRPDSLQVVAVDAVTGSPVPAAPSEIDMFNYRYGRRHSISPGATWNHDFFLLRYVELPGPGRYRFQLRHTLGWPDQTTAPSAPEFTLEFTTPSPSEAAALIAAIPPLGSPSDDSPLPIDSYGFNYPAYIAPLVKRIAAGEPALLDSLGRIATPEATAALIELSTNPSSPVAQAARRNLLHRLPMQEGVTTYIGDTWPGSPAQKYRQVWTTAELNSARALAHTLLQEELPPLSADGFLNISDSPAFIAGAILAHIGEAADLNTLAYGLQKVAYARALDATAYRNRIWALLGEETESLRAAYAGMHIRGIRAPRTATELGAAILAFDDSRLSTPAVDPARFDDRFSTSNRTVGPRSAAWFEQLNLLANLIPWPATPGSGERPGHLGDPATHRPPHPVLMVAALESIPDPLPPECIPFVNFAFESNVPHVIHAACSVAADTHSPVFIPVLLRVLRTESNPRVRATVAKTIAKLGDRRAALQALAEDLATTPEPEQLLRQLADLLFGKNQPAGGYNIPLLSRTERLALLEAWRAFLRNNDTRLAQEPNLAPGDPAIPASLFADSIIWKLPTGSLWPDRAK